MKFLRLGLFLFVSLILSAGRVSAQPLDQTLAAHGGLDKWRAFAGVEYDQKSRFGENEAADHQLFNLWTRDGLITADNYTLGSSGGQVWIKPGPDALGGTPPRFYLWTPFYFFSMPFVFADPGAKQESLGKRIFRGKEYEAVKITYAKGAGDTPDDYYVAYIDPADAQLKMAYYIVTYPALRKGKGVDELEPHAILFQEWQKADGLLVPRRASFYRWNGREIEGEPIGAMEFSNVHFSKDPPDPAKFEKPVDAVVAPLGKDQS